MIFPETADTREPYMQRTKGQDRCHKGAPLCVLGLQDTTNTSPTDMMVLQYLKTGKRNIINHLDAIKYSGASQDNVNSFRENRC